MLLCPLLLWSGLHSVRQKRTELETNVEVLIPRLQCVQARFSQQISSSIVKGMHLSDLTIMKANEKHPI